MTNFLKKLFAITLVISAFSAFAQPKNLTGEINWNQPETFAEDAKRLSFEGASYNLGDVITPSLCLPISLPSTNNTLRNIELVGFQSTKLTNNELALLNRNLISDEPQVTKNIAVGGENIEGGLCLLPIYFDGTSYRKVTQYEISYEVSTVAANKGRSYKKSTVNSPLATEGWHKVAVSKTGVYKITPSYFEDNNIGSGSVAIGNIRVLGNGLSTLPRVVETPRPEGLLEVPLKVVDANNNGEFDGNDYALFYAKGPDAWSYNQNQDEYKHEVNVYRDYNYYFISTSHGSGERIGATSTVPNFDETVNEFDDFKFVEDEDVNLVGTGREWYGDIFDLTLNYNYDFSFPDRVQTEPLKIEVQALARVSSNTTELKIFNGANELFSVPFTRYATHQGANFANISRRSAMQVIPGDNFTLRLQYDNSSNPSGVAWLDYVRVQARRNLIFRGEALYFQDAESVEAGNTVQFQIANANPNMEVWEVTDHNSVKEIPLTFSGSNATFNVATDSLRYFVALAGNNFPSPSYVQPVAPQNLRNGSAAEMLIVTHKNFLTAANRLADFHRNHDDLTVKVATVEEIYNEFSSGGQDVTAIRDYSRYNYELGNGSYKHLLLFGDASYDYKDRLSNNTNFVPVLQLGGSLSLYSSSITDDYFAFLDPQEGNLTGTMDIGVGRIPSKNTTEASASVDKAIRYATSSQTFGEWRNRILMMADDVDDAGFEEQFVRKSEAFVRSINSSKTFNVEKIYTDAYQQKSTTGSETYPEASEDMFRQVQQGNLVTNYIGHGGEIGLASEKLLDLSDVKNWTNANAMPLFCTITCEFTRFDDPKRTSAGELLALKPDGGAVALLTTTRVVYVGPAVNLNAAVFRTIFDRPGNKPKTFGEIIKDAKNDPDVRGDGQNLKFSLIGDPAIRLAIPYYNMNITEVNGVPLAQAAPDTLGTLGKVQMSGNVNDFSGNVMTDFSGIANVSVFDKETQRKTLRNDNQGDALSFTQQNNLIYKGKVEVTAGKFDFEFIVPKDVSKAFGFGKVSLYSDNNEIDAAGYMDTIVVGGFSDDIEDDNLGPEVELFMNDESFVRGGVTGNSPELYARVSDSSGINTVGTGIGHDLVATLDGNSDQSFVVNQFYEADLNSYQSGKIRYPFYELEEGEHSLELEVFDVHNNVTKSTTEFVVADNAELALERVLNYPNPFTTYTEFHFEHNRVGVPMDVQVQIFTVSGKLVKTINQSLVPGGNRVTGISWNGLDDYGDKIGKGVYVYRVKVRTELDDDVAEKYEKLVILR